MKQAKLPKGSIEIIEALKKRGGLTQIQLIDTIDEKKPRAVRYIIKTLIEKNVLIKRPNFHDMRSSILYINEKMKEATFNLLKIHDSNINKLGS